MLVLAPFRFELQAAKVEELLFQLRSKLLLVQSLYFVAIGLSAFGYKESLAVTLT